MIVCSKCGKENEDRYKFCLGCGAQLLAPEPDDPSAEGGGANLPFTPVSPTPPSGVEPGGAPVSGPAFATTAPDADGTAPRKVPTAAQPAATPVPVPDLQPPPGATPAPVPDLQPPPGATPAPVPDLEPPPAAEPATVACSQCGASNPKEFVFCGNCGTRLKAPADPVQRSSTAAPQVKRAAIGKLALIRPDGSEGGTYELESEDTLIGRGAGPLFDNDSYLSPRHARFHVENGQLFVSDVGSLNGVFVKLVQDELLEDGDVFRIGQELLRFDVVHPPQLLDDGTEVMGSPNPGYSGRLSIIVGPGVDGSAFPLMGDEVVLGREHGDILFSDDGYVSGTHAKLVLSERGCMLSDLGSSNGTFIRINEQRPVASGTFVLIGQQLFRVDHQV